MCFFPPPLIMQENVVLSRLTYILLLVKCHNCPNFMGLLEKQREITVMVQITQMGLQARKLHETGFFIKGKVKI